MVQVEIEELGVQGDGIGRMGSGNVVFVPDTLLHDRVTVENTTFRGSLAFDEFVGHDDTGDI